MVYESLSNFQHVNEQRETGAACLYVTPTWVCETLIELAEYEMPPQFPRQRCCNTDIIDLQQWGTFAITHAANALSDVLATDNVFYRTVSVIQSVITENLRPAAL